MQAGTVGVDIDNTVPEGLHGQLGGIHDPITVGVRA
jgi:hypothetical protein